MSRKKGLGIFGKIFLYTLLLLIFIITTLVLFFGDQVNLIFEQSQIYLVEEPLMNSSNQNDSADIIAENVSEPVIEGNGYGPAISGDGYEPVIFGDEYDPVISGDGYEPVIPGDEYASAMPKNVYEPLKAMEDMYTEFIAKTTIALAILLTASIFMAALFARSLATPIKKLAEDTAKMSRLEFASAPTTRGDEIGQLYNDVYKMYDALKSEIEREKEREENQRYFFSAVSHELKTPIAATSSMLEGMIANVVKPSEHPEYLKKCLNMMTMQKNLISEMLEIIRLDDSKIEPKMEAIPLRSVIQSVLYAHQTLADTKMQTIDVSVPNTLSCFLDQNLFSRALSNILINAVQNTPEEGCIRIWCEERDNQTVRLHILNSNAHVDEKSLPKLYDPFYRADKARSRNQNRSGLGLTIVKKSLDYMNIPFVIENRGNDVVFWMDLSI